MEQIEKKIYLSVKAPIQRGRKERVNGMSIRVRGKENIVPVDMRVQVKNQHGRYEVSYEKCKGEFAYEFKVFPKTAGAKEAVEEVVRAMETQSYDHSSCWQRTNVEEFDREDEFDMYRFFKVNFRIRDGY